MESVRNDRHNVGLPIRQAQSAAGRAFLTEALVTSASSSQSDHAALNASAKKGGAEAALSPSFASLYSHYESCVLPIWKKEGFHLALGLPFEAVQVKAEQLAEAEEVALSAPAPVRYRAMACARQLFVFTEVGDRAHADSLFNALTRLFRDPADGGYYYSLAPDGAPLDTTKDLYTHAFVIFACAAYLERFDVSEARDVIQETADLIEQRFTLDPLTGLHHAAFSQDFSTVLMPSRQNPLMHLTEAYLLARRVCSPARFDSALQKLLMGIAASFVDPGTQCVMELPNHEENNWLEPGHQFEWFFLAQSSAHPAFASAGLDKSLSIAFEFGFKHGVDANTGGVVASLDRNGLVTDPNQRIWAQTEYLRALANHPLPHYRVAAVAQAERFQARFLHARGWHECLDANGNVVRADMPATTPYHLATAYASLHPGNIAV